MEPIDSWRSSDGGIRCSSEQRIEGSGLFRARCERRDARRGQSPHRRTLCAGGVARATPRGLCLSRSQLRSTPSPLVSTRRLGYISLLRKLAIPLLAAFPPNVPVLCANKDVSMRSSFCSSRSSVAVIAILFGVLPVRADLI